LYSFDIMTSQTSAVLHRSTQFLPKKAVGGEGNYVILEDGQRFLDSTGGAAVSCLGHGNKEIMDAVKAQLDKIAYCHSAFFGTQVFEELASFLIDSTGGKLSKAFIVSSGTIPDTLSCLVASFTVITGNYL
jgi:adenosylmethionine-8-amino-7-oxononanoate aminotransferase